MTFRPFKIIGSILIINGIISCTNAAAAPEETSLVAECMLAVPTPYRIPPKSTPEVISENIDNRKIFRSSFDEFTKGSFPVVGIGFYTLTYSSENCATARMKLEAFYDVYPFVDNSSLFSSTVARDENGQIIVPEELKGLVENSSPLFLNNENRENK